jgi:tellurite resistance protein TerC
LAAERAVTQALRLGRRIGIAIAGSLVVAVGVAMIVLPGPAIVVIPLGLGILSLEFERPRIWLAWLRARAVKVRDGAQQRLQARRARGKGPDAR